MTRARVVETIASLPAWLALAAILLGARGAAAAPLAATGTHVLLVVESIESTSAGLGTKLDVRLGRPVVSGAGASAVLAMPAMHRTPASLGIEGVPAWDYGTKLRGVAAIEALAAARLQGAAPALERQLESAMQASGADMAIFTLLQTVEPLAPGGPAGTPVGAAAGSAGISAGAAPRATLAWTHVRMPGQVEHFSAPRVRSDASVLLSVRYTPRRIAADLPAAIAYRDAGILSWVSADSALLPAGVPTRIDTLGAFDEPDPAPGAATDPDAGLRCLVDHRGAGCNASLPDVRGLLASEGASVAVLEYRRRLSAMRAQVTLADGSTAWEMLLATEVQRRSLSTAGSCPGRTAEYRNLGTRGYAVIAASDRYLVTGRGEPRIRPVGSATDSEVVQGEPYDKQVSVTNSTPASLDPLVINPAGDQLDLVPATSIPGLARLAPIESPACATVRRK